MIQKQYFNIPGAKGRGMLMDLTFNDAVKHAPLVIFVHGFKGFKDWGSHNLLAHYFASSGLRFLKFNFSHSGITAANPYEITDLIAFADNTFSIELDDLKSVIDFACNGASMSAVKTVSLIGHSMGGGISVIKAAEDPRVQKLVTMASVSNFRNLWPSEIEAQWRLQGITYMTDRRTGREFPLKINALEDLDRYPGRLDILSHAAQVKQPWLIVHGEEDPTVPVICAEQLKAANAGAELYLVAGANHTFNSGNPYTESILPPALLTFADAAIAFLK